MNLLTSSQIRKADEATIRHQGITSLELMDRAAAAFVMEFMRDVVVTAKITVLCGPGNNGGDGLAIARLLQQRGYHQLSVCIVAFSDGKTAEQDAQRKRLEQTNISVTIIHDAEAAHKISSGILIDAILGAGLNKPLAGKYLEFVKIINDKSLIVYAVDMPSGFPAEGTIDDSLVAIKATRVICFQLPKINFFFPESARYMDDFKVVDIGLDDDFITTVATDWKLTLLPEIQRLIKPRANFSHKGTFGHVLIVAGQEQTMGAALLAARASLLTGAGLTTAAIPQSGLTALNTSLPEIMYLPQTTVAIGKQIDRYTALGFGPGLGMEPTAKSLLVAVMKLTKPMVIDADGLNLLAEIPELLHNLPENSVLTPHVKEFDRLFGNHTGWWQRLETAREQAKKFKVVILLKNQYTFVVMPNGQVYINTTGGPAMASGGMGDVLTGMIASFLAQGYTAGESAILASYIHGKAGDELARTMSNVTASMIAEQIPFCLAASRTP